MFLAMKIKFLIDERIAKYFIRNLVNLLYKNHFSRCLFIS